jgi:hypothetical protein
MVIGEALRASKIAFIICGLSIICLWLKFIPTYYFAAALGAWMLYSLYKSIILIKKQRIPASVGEKNKEGLSYWLGALGSSLLAALVWVVLVALAFANSKSLP